MLDPALLRSLLQADARQAAAVAQAARTAAVAGAASDAAAGDSANWEQLLGGAPWLAPQEEGGRLEGGEGLEGSRRTRTTPSTR